jgi:hypothetical protein
MPHSEVYLGDMIALSPLWIRSKETTRFYSAGIIERDAIAYELTLHRLLILQQYFVVGFPVKPIPMRRGPVPIFEVCRETWIKKRWQKFGLIVAQFDFEHDSFSMSSRTS